MKREDAEEFTQSLGQIMGGSWRQIAWAQKQGIPKALGLTTDQWVRQRLGGYVKLSIEERREAALELASEGASTREIAGVLGVGHVTAARDLAVTNVTDNQIGIAENQRDNTASVANETEEKKAANAERLARIKAQPIVRGGVKCPAPQPTRP